MQRIKIARETEFGVVCVYAYNAIYQNSYAENGFGCCVCWSYIGIVWRYPVHIALRLNQQFS